jgi:hypothetical protein
MTEQVMDAIEHRPHCLVRAYERAMHASPLLMHGLPRKSAASLSTCRPCRRLPDRLRTRQGKPFNKSGDCNETTRRPA